MANTIQLFVVVLAGISVGIADALIKKSALAGDFWAVVKNPLMVAILFLYLMQIVLFSYVFASKWNLSVVGNLEIVFYSLTVLLCGLLFFGETISTTQMIGIALALVGVVLMNL